MSKKINEIMALFYIALIAIAAALMWMIGASMVSAQGIGVGYGSADSDSQSWSHSQAGSQSSITQNYYNSGRSEVQYSGSYDVKNVPSVSAPGIVTAHNCALGASVGGSGMGWGLSLGGSYVDDNCETISQAAALNTLAGANVAIAHLARVPEICLTLRNTGKLTPDTACTESERRAAAQKRKKSKSASAAPTVRTTKPPLKVKCEKRGGKTVPIVTKEVASAYSTAEIKRACK